MINNRNKNNSRISMKNWTNLDFRYDNTLELKKNRKIEDKKTLE